MNTVSIYESVGYTDELIPDGYDAVKIVLDGTLKSDLNWSVQKEAAWQFVEQGYRLFWEMDLGIGTSLPKSLQNETQSMSLQLSLEHFLKTMWTDFAEKSAGAALYRGGCDFTKGFIWDEEQLDHLTHWIEAVCPGTMTPTPHELMQTREGEKLLQLYCADALSEYVEGLASHTPPELALYLLIDAGECADPVHLANLLNKERFPHFNLAIRGGGNLPRELGWEDTPGSRGYIGKGAVPMIEAPAPTVAVALPFQCIPSAYAALKKPYEALEKKGIPFRMIPESLLTTEWSGLDYIVIAPELMGPQGKRKLMGFCAAGGTVVSLGENLGLPQELGFQEWLAKK